tara:strand:- start:97 stop:522 length:426 start_codon:yes stop_codon:yes gene_type:complete
MEDEFIKNILNNSKKQDKISKLTSNEIKQEVERVVKEFYKPYLTFDKNKENMKETIAKLEDYIYVKDISDIPNSYYIRYLDTKYFYDLTLRQGGFLINVNDNKLKLYTGKIYIKIDSSKIVLFMKLKKKDKMNILLNDLNK